MLKRNSEKFMNTIILSHERSLNKAEALLSSYNNCILVIDRKTDINEKPYVKHANKIIISKNFDLVDIISNVNVCNKIWCVSENLLPIQSQLESYYGIENLSPFAAEILSNKQKFDDYCRKIGLGEFVPVSVTPTFHNQLDKFKNQEFFTKPDIGTGSNVFFPGSNQNAPNIEYRRWNNKHHFLKHLKDKQIHNDFFALNKQGIYTEKFNFKPCRIMAQQYHWSEQPSVAPIGAIINSQIHIAFYLKMSKVKYGDLIDPNSSPIESHSHSKSSDIVKDRAVWITDSQDVSEDIKQKINYFMKTLLDSLKVKNLFFAGPDFHISEGRLIAIDFNPRPGQFINILERLEGNSIIQSLINNCPTQIKTKLLWGCSVLQPGKIKTLKDTSSIKPFFNVQNTLIQEGIQVPEFQNLQNKAFNVNLDITGSNEQELFERYKTVNQLLQKCISY